MVSYIANNETIFQKIEMQQGGAFMKTKRFMSLFISIAVFFVFCAVPVSADAPTEKWIDIAADAFAGGDGSAETPYEIATAAQLAKLAVDVNLGIYGEAHENESFVLTADIDLGGRLWTPIGLGKGPATSYACFEGFFDGANHKITNMYVSESDSSAGLFGHLGANVDGVYTVQNLKIENATVITTASEGMAGILSAYATTSHSANALKIRNCHVSGTVSSLGQAGGLIAEANYLDAENCSADADVTGNGFTAAFIGKIFYPDIRNCTADGTVNGTWSIGGFAGAVTNNLTEGAPGITNCFSYADVTAANWNAGGFIGYTEGTAVEKCAAYGNVSSSMTNWPPKVGGFTGSLTTCSGWRTDDSTKTYIGTLINCYYAGSLSSAHATTDPSGLIADFVGGTVTDCAYDSDKNPGLQAVSKVDGTPGDHTAQALSTAALTEEICTKLGHSLTGANICTRCGVSVFGLAALTLTADSVSVSCPAGIPAAALVVASYAQNKLIDMQIVFDVPADYEATLASIGLQYADATTVKAFLWSYLSFVAPLCRAEIYTQQEGM